MAVIPTAPPTTLPCIYPSLLLSLQQPFNSTTAWTALRREGVDLLRVLILKCLPRLKVWDSAQMEVALVNLGSVSTRERAKICLGTFRGSNSRSTLSLMANCSRTISLRLDRFSRDVDGLVYFIILLIWDSSCGASSSLSTFPTPFSSFHLFHRYEACFLRGRGIILTLSDLVYLILSCKPVGPFN